MLPDADHQAEVSAAIERNEDIPEPDSLDDLSDLFNLGGVVDLDTPSDSSNSTWLLSTINPASVFVKLPGINLNPNYRLVSYFFRAEGSSVGVVWAVPIDLATTAQLEKALQNSTTISAIPRPEGALAYFMEAVEGDRSAASFVIASLLKREFQEFGATGRRCNWRHHRLIEEVPPKIDWQWQGEPPHDLMPKVKVADNGQAWVEFYTCRVVAPVTIYRHLDHYVVPSYKPNSIDKSVAVGQR